MPQIYVRYVDDILIATQSFDKINKQEKTLEKFTTELSFNKSSPPRRSYWFQP